MEGYQLRLSFSSPAEPAGKRDPGPSLAPCHAPAYIHVHTGPPVPFSYDELARRLLNLIELLRSGSPSRRRRAGFTHVGDIAA